MYSKTRILAKSITPKTYVGVDNLLQNRQGKKDSGHLPVEGALTEYRVGDILLGNIRPYLKKIWQASNVGGTNGDVLVVRINDSYHDKIKPEFLYHLLASDKFFDYSMRNSKGAKMPRGDKSAILKYLIPVPPIDQQEQVVSVLQRFDKLVNSISEGIPAEITARRKQYEYYRTKLLTFKDYSI